MELIETVKNLKDKIKQCNFTYDLYIDDIKRVIKIFESNYNFVKNNDELLTYLAILYLYNREDRKSIKFFKKAYQKNKNLQTTTNLAYFYLYEGDLINNSWKESPKKSIGLLKRIIQANCPSFRPYSLVAECYFELKEYIQMEKYLRISIKNEVNYKNIFNLGVSLFYQDKYHEALDYFRQSVELKNIDHGINGYFNIALCNLFLNKTEIVNEVLEYLEKNNEDEIIGILEIADIYLLLEDYEKAIKNYSEANNYYFSIDWVSEYLYCYYKVGKTDEFNSFYDKVLNLKKNDIIEHRNNEEFDLKYEEELKKDIEDLNKAKQDILSNCFNINKKFDLFIEKDCYLFGCIQHDVDYKITKNI